jgi:hypothetical protein
MFEIAVSKELPLSLSWFLSPVDAHPEHVVCTSRGMVPLVVMPTDMK